MEVSPSANPKKVLYVITKANWGGAQRYVYDLALAARNKGHEVAVVSGTDGEMRTRLEKAGIRTILVPMRNEPSFGAIHDAYRALLPILKNEGPGIVHLNSSLAGIAGALAARSAGVKRIIFTAHGWAFNEDRPKWQKALIWSIHYATVLLSDMTICVSNAMRRDTRTMPFIQAKIQVIHNGIGEETLLSREEARAALLSSEQRNYWIGSIAELHPTKQLSVLIKAFARLNQDNAALVIIGEGNERPKLEQLIAELDAGDRIHLLGHVANASRYLPALDHFVLPSRSEGLAYVLLEAGRAALPVAASRVGGIPEIIQDNVTGHLFPSGNVPALTAILEESIRDPEASKRLGNALKQRVQTSFSLGQMATATLALY